ncbi:phage tail protein [Curvivirga sp.]|uniref:phage tail protein n=1 Tax=Curvivirga sp. TaxID=2856848 RepID=UPI003B5C12F6
MSTSCTLNDIGQIIETAIAKARMPVGTFFYFTGEAAPEGALILDGSEIARVDYPALWIHAQSSGMLVEQSSKDADVNLMSKFGTGNGTSTFTLGDFRGEFIRNLDVDRGVDMNRELGSFQPDQFKSHSHQNGLNESRVSDNGGHPGPGHNGFVNNNYPETSVGGDETRPRNIALLPCILY